MVWLAENTLKAINDNIVADNGAAFRQRLQQVLPHMKDAYDKGKSPFRKHLGASVIANECERSIAFSYMWAWQASPRGRKGEDKIAAHSRMQRLWNRGHLEEGRFIAMLLAAGIAVYQQQENGKQFGFVEHGGHYAGSSDGILMGVPDLPAGVPCLSEFKTHSDKSFTELQDKGVKEAKPVHYGQMQIYMGRLGLQYALYFAVNKNTDDLYAEIVVFDGVADAAYMQRAKDIIFADTLPPRIRNASPGFFKCKYMCDFPLVCFHTKKPSRSCRTCQNGVPDPTQPFWICKLTGELLDKDMQIEGCEEYHLDGKFTDGIA